MFNNDVKDELVARYRNLLVALAKSRIRLDADIEWLRMAATEEANLGRRAGLNAKANALRRHSLLMEALIRRNNVALRHLFGTADIGAVAQHEFVMYKPKAPYYEGSN